MNSSAQAVDPERKNACWILTQGAAGMQSQVRGLAAALGYPQPVEKICGLHLPWRWLPNHPLLARLAAASGDRLAPPWPELLITCGRKAALLSMAVRRASRGRVRTIHIQDPKVAAHNFDLVVVPAHDRMRGPNVLVSRGALHHITDALLQAAAERFAARLGPLPRPRIAAMVGGPNRYFDLPADWLARLADELAESARRLGGSLMVSISRRTPPETAAVLRQRIAGLPHDLWLGEGENPYPGYLALADAILVTGDSTSMISEACATGAPVHVAQPPTRRAGAAVPPRFAAFYRAMEEVGATRPWNGPLTDLPPRGPGFNDTLDIAAEIRRRLDLPPGPGSAGR